MGLREVANEIARAVGGSADGALEKLGALARRSAELLAAGETEPYVMDFLDGDGIGRLLGAPKESRGATAGAATGLDVRKRAMKEIMREAKRISGSDGAERGLPKPAPSFDEYAAEAARVLSEGRLPKGVAATRGMPREELAQLARMVFRRSVSGPMAQAAAGDMWTTIKDYDDRSLRNFLADLERQNPGIVERAMADRAKKRARG